MYVNPYQTYQNGYQPQALQNQGYSPSYPAPCSNGINWVSGESGAKSWMVGRGETVLLMDSENQVFYIKSADASGMPLPLRVFDYTERTQNVPNGTQNAQKDTECVYITRSEFDDLRAKYEELEKQIRKPAKKGEKADESTV